MRDFKEELAEFIDDYDGPEDGDDIIAALREAADNLEKSRAA